MHKFIYILFSCFFIVSLQAQKFEQKFTRISTKDGLSQNHVKAIYQDRDGYMWFGTEDGLNRFDGKNFKTFNIDDNKSKGLVHSTVNHIAYKNDNELWICTELGVSIYYISTQTFSTFKFLTDINVKTCLPDTQGNTWFGTNQGLYVYMNDTDRLIGYKNTKKQGSISNDQIYSLCLDSEENLWIGTDNGLCLYQPSTNSFKNYLTTENSLPGQKTRVHSISEDADGRLWLGLLQKGLYLFENSKDRPDNGHFKLIEPGSVNILLADSQNKLWVGKSGPEGIAIIDLSSVNNRTDLKIKHFKHSPYNEKSISDNSISTLFEDKNGDIWIGTYAGGVDYHSRKIKQFNNFKSVAGEQNSISSDFVNCFFDDGEFLWIGTSEGLNRMHKATGTIKRYKHHPDQPYSIGKGAVYSIYKDKFGYLWAGTWSGGLNKLDTQTNRFTTYLPSLQPGSISSPNIYAITSDSKGNLWIGTIEGGLNRYDYDTDTFITYKNDPHNAESLYNNSINNIYPTADGDILMTCYSSLEIFNPETGTFKHFVHDPQNPQSIGRGQTQLIFKDSNNHYWIGNNLGLNLFNKHDGTFIRYTTDDGLPNNTILGILEDDNANLWISTNKGLVKFIKGASTPLQPQFKIYTRDDGLPSNDFTIRAACRGTDGYLNFGSSSGFTRFHPSLIFENNVPPNVVISEIKITNAPKQEGLLPWQSKNINDLSQIKLTYQQNDITIQYAALSYLEAEKNQYRFILEGYDTEWHDAGSSQLATYTNLNPGNYSFKVYGCNNDGIWSKKPKILHIKITPPWWETNWFISLSVFLVALGIYLFINHQINRVERRNRELEEKIAQRTRQLSETNTILEESKEEIYYQNLELEQHRERLEELVRQRTMELEKAKVRAETSDRLKTAFLANMSHEIRTPMNAIVGFSNLLEQTDLTEDERKRYIQIINENSDALLILINDILDISKIEANQITFTPQPFNINEILIDIEAYYKLNNSRNIEIKFMNKNDKNESITCDPFRFRQIFSNLISNAIKYTEKGYVRFGYKTGSEETVFFVKDSGIGIEEEHLDKIFNHFYKVEHINTKLFRGTGIGLAISKKLTELMGGRIWVQSIPQQGSVFFFTIPKKEAATNN
ncbi:two-component regulator propeller domain-containing protein [Geofilum sp. OHC36d9]|uniref:two-component regulator propeller domain-containing protein n=1 Tax=Geofilum sp. OHC36d9 TaxID=3458413 RepID=UPI004034F139